MAVAFTSKMVQNKAFLMREIEATYTLGPLLDVEGPP